MRRGSYAYANQEAQIPEPVRLTLEDAGVQFSGPIRLASDLTHEEIRQSAVAQNALLLLRAAAADAGLKLTARGNLTRRVVAEMCDVFAWPGVDKADAFQLQKVVNEPDFLPLFFVRNVVEAAKLPRPRKGYLKSTPAGRKSQLAETFGLPTRDAASRTPCSWRWP